MKTFSLPDLGEGLHEAQIVEWHVAVGDEVAEDDIIVSVETDKAVTEVPTPWSGRIARLCGDVGHVIKVGEAIVEYAGDGGAATAPPQAPALETSDSIRPRPANSMPGARVAAMPAVRLLAAELGIALDGVAGSGPGGTVLARDLAQAARPHAAVETTPEADGWEPLIGPRRTMARNMALAHAEVVPATVHEEADIGAWVVGEDVTLRLVRALLAGVAAEPALNCWFDAGRGRRLHQTVDLGIAVDAPDGLFVPVLRGAERLGRDELRQEIDRLVAGARERTLAAVELKGATITLSNFGMIAGLHAAPVVVPPQVAILGAGRSRDQVVARGGEPAVSRVLPLSLTYDHRAATGGEAARFIRAVVDDLTAAD